MSDNPMAPKGPQSAAPHTGDGTTPPPEHNDPSPKSVAELFLAEINPIQQFKIANAASQDAFYFFKHPQDLLLPQVMIESGALRVGHAAIDTIKTPINMLQDTTGGLKHGVEAGKDILDAPLDIIGLHPVQAAKDVGNAAVNVVKGVGDVAKAAVVDPIKGVANVIGDIF